MTGVIAAAMVFAACGGSSKSSSGGGGGGSATTAGGNSNTQITNSNLAKADIQVTYTSSDSTNPTASTTLTFGQDGKGKTFFTSGPSGSGSTIFVDSTGMVSCEGTGPTAQCTQLPAAESALGTSLTAGFTALATVVTVLGGGNKSSVTIAGRDASCHAYKADDVIAKLATNAIFKNSDLKPGDYNANDTFSICLDKQTGFPLRVAGTKKGQADAALTATAVSQPSESAFTPPVTPVTLPNVSIPVTSVP